MGAQRVGPRRVGGPLRFFHPLPPRFRSLAILAQAILAQGCDGVPSSSLELDLVLVCLPFSSGQSAIRFQAPGLIAVGQRLAPLSEVRASLSAAQLSPIFLPYRAREGCRTILCAGVPAFKENPPEDDDCSICGFADGRVVNAPCCGIPVHSECAHGGCLNCGEVPNFDVEFGDDISEDMFSDCVICICAQNASFFVAPMLWQQTPCPHWLLHSKCRVLWFEMPFLLNPFGRVSSKSLGLACFGLFCSRERRVGVIFFLR